MGGDDLGTGGGVLPAQGPLTAFDPASELAAWAAALAASPWIFLVLYACTTIDGFFPPVPSESVVIIMAALSAADGRPNSWLLAAVAAAGAFSGDQIAYSIGRRIPVRRLRVMRSERARKAVIWAENTLGNRGAGLVIGARFIPVGRVAVNMTAGTVGLARVRFSVFAAAAAVAWSTYSVVIGVGAGHLLDERHPLVGVAVGVTGGLVTGALLDRVLQRLRRPTGGIRS